MIKLEKASECHIKALASTTKVVDNFVDKKYHARLNASKINLFNVFKALSAVLFVIKEKEYPLTYFFYYLVDNFFILESFIVNSLF
ncbi:hypothetical protein NBRC116595_36230 [Aliiglaciecola sp. NS0011-25]